MPIFKKVKSIPIFYWILFSGLLFLNGCVEKHMDQISSSAELIIYNAKITTLTAGNPTSSAVAIKDGKIVQVGNDNDLLELKDSSTKVIDANGRRMIPGLNDSHSHFLRSGLAYTRELRWDGVPTLKEGLDMIREQSKYTPEGEWIRVIGGWTPWQFEERRLPSVDELNEAAPNVPLYMQYFYSVGILNKKGMEALDIGASTADPKGGKFVRDEKGNPTGLMLATPHPGIFYGKIAALPGTSKEIEANSTIHLFHELARFGLTSVIDAGGGGFNYPDDYSTAEKLAIDGKLPVRVSFYLFTQNPGKELEDYIEWTRNNKAGYNADPVKPHGFELDGGGEYLLWKAGDFENFRSDRPILDSDMEKDLEPIIELLIQKRWPFRIHATYDESINRILNVIERVNKKTPLDGLRWSIEHAETVTERNIDRIAALKGGIAIQDRMVFLGDDYVKRYGAEAAKKAPPIRMILDKGVPLGIGTDGTRGSSFNPWVGLHWLISGKTASGRELYDKDNLISREEALYLYTVGSAWFSNEEEVKGRIAEGQLADFALLTDDYFSVPVEQIKDIESVLTVVDGKVVFAAKEYAHYAPKLTPIMPDWSPVKRFGSYWKN
jgi:predicted amidohydrolase YtcJ